MSHQPRIGISGWRYGPWRGTFYPANWPQSRELEYAACKLNSIEINGSFYSLQRPDSYQLWYEQTPADFVFSLKGGRFITHMKKLRDVEVPLANFLASGILALKEKLGPILWQFPPNFGLDLERFETFFKLLPHDTSEAAEFAKRHDAKLKHGAWTKTDRCRKLRYAVEVRHHSFLDPAFFKLLRRHNIAFCFADSAGIWPYAEDVTADFVYLRLHGAEQMYASGYTDSMLDWWADRIRAWSSGSEPRDARKILDKPPKPRSSRDIYIYFDNDMKVKAPFDAMALSRRLIQGQYARAGHGVPARQAIAFAKEREGEAPAEP
jgi:uncharacterized protein YecE (DUF72 family)